MRKCQLLLLRMAWLPCLLSLLFACKQYSHMPEGGCGTLRPRFDSLAGNPQTPDSVVALQLRQLYSDAASGCKPAIAAPLAAKIFKLAARNRLDTSLPAFLNLMANDAGLYPLGRAWALANRAACFILLQENSDSGFALLEKVNELNVPANDTLSKTYHALMAHVMKQKVRLTDAASHFLKAIEYAEKTKDSLYVANLYSNFATLYTQMGEHEKAIGLKRKGLAYYVVKNNEYEQLTAYISLGASFTGLKQYDSAIAYNQKGIQLLEKGVQNISSAFYLYVNQASVYELIKKDDSARHYFGKAYPLLLQIDNPVYEMQYNISSAPVFAAVRDITAQTRQIEGYIPILKENGDLANLKDVYYCLHNIAANKNQPATALDFYKKYDSVNNLIASEENKRLVAEMETKYETQKKELQIQLQQKQIKQKNTQNTLLTALLLVVGLAAAFIITRIQLKREQKEAALQQHYTTLLLQNTEEERSRIARDLHDGVSQELMLLKNDIKKGKTDTTEKVDDIINDIRMISRELHPMMLDKIGLAQSVEHYCDRLMEQQELFVSCDIDYNGSMGKNEELQIFRIIQEAMNNVVKYAGAEAAKITINGTDSHWQVEIKDNGRGFDVQGRLASGKAFGLQSMVERARAIHGKATISSSASGTVVNVTIPKTQAGKIAA